MKNSRLVRRNRRAASRNRARVFPLRPAATRVLASDDGSMAVVVAPWTSTGFHPDGVRFDRPGHATIVFHKQGSTWLGVHSHLSLNRGVPHSSHGNRPVKAR